MKPILILKLVVEQNRIIPLSIWYNDDYYFRDLTNDVCSKYPKLNDITIKQIIY